MPGHLRTNRVPLRASALLLVVAGAAGCRSALGPLDRLPAGPTRVHAEHRLDEAVRGVGPGYARLENEPVQDVLPRGATADDYVRVALRRNPALVAAQLRVERMGERIPQVTSLEDPMLQVSPVGEMAQTAAGEVSVMAGVSQRFPFPGTLRARGRVASAEVAQAAREVEQERLRVEADTRRAYWSYWYAFHAVDTLEQNAALLRQLRQVAESQYRAGSAAQQDVLRASTELGAVQAEIATTRQRLASAAAMLNQLMNRPAGSPLPEPPPADARISEVRLDRLLRIAAEANPSLARLRDRIEEFRLRRRLAEVDRLPDFTVGLQYNAVDEDGLAVMANGDDQWWLSFGISLPIWAKKYDAAEREAVLGMAETTAMLAAETDRVSFRVEDAFARVQAQQELLRLFRDAILPEARQTIEASESAYRAGSVDFLTVIDNWRRLLNFELMERRSVSELEQAYADLRQAIGQDIPAASEGTAHNATTDQDNQPLAAPGVQPTVAAPAEEDTQ